MNETLSFHSAQFLRLEDITSARSHYKMYFEYFRYEARNGSAERQRELMKGAEHTLSAVSSPWPLFLEINWFSAGVKHQKMYFLFSFEKPYILHLGISMMWK